jgi:hypothetical protein
VQMMPSCDQIGVPIHFHSSQQDSAERAFNKLVRTFAAQVEALKRYRTGGEQTVRVERVTVNEGGQAIVGNVSHGGWGSPEKMETSS